MLAHIRVQNIALIRSLSLQLNPGLNVITGETGAGKSILIDAVNLVLGTRADREIITVGEEKASVEATFTRYGQDVNELLDQLGIEPEDTVVLSRDLYANGRNVCRINGSLVNNAALRTVSEKLIDIHGQHEHQSLLHPQAHLQLLDAFGGAPVAAAKTKVATLLQQARQIDEELQRLGGQDGERERRMDLLQYQIDEIDAANIQPDEDERLRQERVKLSNAEKIYAAFSQVEAGLFGEEEQIGAYTLLGQVSREIHAISSLDPAYQTLGETLDELYYAVEAAGDDARALKDQVVFDPAYLETVSERLDVLSRLKTKYGGTLEAVLQTKQQAEEELYTLSHSAQIIERLQKERKQTLEQLYKASLALHECRQKAGEELSKRICVQLAELGMPHAQFAISFAALPAQPPADTRAYSHNGLDQMEFLLSANAGMPLRPLSKIVSGGEASRIMLAIKTIAAELDAIDCLIFDEVDTGISGQIAYTVGEKMARIAQQRQVLCVTHLAQLACMADTHFLIEKKSDQVMTQTMLHTLDADQRIDEIARLVGGTPHSAHGRAHAKEMIEQADAYKKSL